MIVLELIVHACWLYDMRASSIVIRRFSAIIIRVVPARQDDQFCQN